METALGLSDGLVFAEDAKSGDITTFSAKFACPVSGFTIDEVEPRLFSFNNPFGACPKCDGLGHELYFDPDLVVPDHSLSLEDGALAPWAKSTSKYYMQTLQALGAYFDFDLDVPFKDLPSNARDILLNGSGREQINFFYEDGTRAYKTTRPLKVCCQTWTAAIARPKVIGCAMISQNIKTAKHARPVMDIV